MVVFGGAVTLAAAVGALTGPGAVSPPQELYVGTLDWGRHQVVHQALVSEAALAPSPIGHEAIQSEVERARSLIAYSARYNVAADLAALVYDTAVEEGLDPELAFRLVYVESRFNHRAVSSAGAYGLAQVLPATARFYEPDLVPEGLFDRALNLRIGFAYLHDLLEAYDGNLALALIAYNRGPGRLRQLLARGVQPWNGYASKILDGYLPSQSSDPAFPAPPGSP